MKSDYSQTDQENSTAANFFDQNYQAYDFPATSAALAAATNNTNVTTSFPFHPHPHPQHPHLGVEALGHAAAASQHVGRVAVPDVSAPEGEGGNHVFNETNGGDHSMDLTLSSTAGDTTSASMNQSAQQIRSSGKAARSSLSVPGSDPDHKKDTPYSRSPDMRNSHKMAERKRRKEMKDLFDELRDELPVDRGPKTSKWEILSKAVEHIRELRKERNDIAAEVHALRGGVEHTGESMTGVEDQQQPPPAPEDGTVGDDYTKYEQQQVASQQQVEAAAAAANQFTAHHDYTQPTEDDNGHQDEYKSEVVTQEHTEQDWGAIAAQAQAQAQVQAQAQSA